LKSSAASDSAELEKDQPCGVCWSCRLIREIHDIFSVSDDGEEESEAEEEEDDDSTSEK
jgi:hypothetical protein